MGALFLPVGAGVVLGGLPLLTGERWNACHVSEVSSLLSVREGPPSHVANEGFMVSSGPTPSFGALA